MCSDGMNSREELGRKMQNREMRCFPLLSSWIARKNSQNENPINNSTCYDTPYVVCYQDPDEECTNLDPDYGLDEIGRLDGFRSGEIHCCCGNQFTIGSDEENPFEYHCPCGLIYSMESNLVVSANSYDP